MISTFDFQPTFLILTATKLNFRGDQKVPTDAILPTNSVLNGATCGSF